jgi:hypothetical protein
MLPRIDSNRPAPQVRTQEQQPAAKPASRPATAPAPADSFTTAQPKTLSDGQKPATAPAGTAMSYADFMRSLNAPAPAPAANAAGGTQPIPPAQGMDPYYLGAVPENPDEAVARLTDPNCEAYQFNPEQRVKDLMWLAANAPDRLAEVYETIGPEATTELLNQTAQFAAVQDHHQAFPNDAAAASLLNTLALGLSATSPQFQQQVGQTMADQGLLAATLVLKQPGAPDGARSAFIDAAKDRALEDPEWARAAGNVMAGSQAMVDKYAAEWGDDFVKLIETGLNGARTYGGDRNGYDMPSLRNNGLEQIVGMVGNYQGPNADQLKAQVFQTAAMSYETSPCYWDGDNEDLLKGMEQLFVSSSRTIVDELSDCTSDPSDPSGRALGLFFREVLEDPDPNGAVITEANRLFAELKNEVLNSNDASVYGVAGAQMGYLLGALGLGYKAALSENQGSQAAREALVKMAVGAVTGKAGEYLGPAGSILTGPGATAATNLLAGFLNGDLQADAKSMQTIRDTLFNAAFAGLPPEKQTELRAWMASILAWDALPEA